MPRKPWQEEVNGVEGILAATGSNLKAIEAFNDYLSQIDNVQVVICNGRKVIFPVMVENQQGQNDQINLHASEQNLVIVDIAKKTVTLSESVSRNFARREDAKENLEGYSFEEKTSEEMNSVIDELVTNLLKVGNSKKKRFSFNIEFTKDLGEKEAAKRYRNKQVSLVEIEEHINHSPSKPANMIELAEQTVAKGESDAISAMQKKAREERIRENERRKEEIRTQRQERLADDLQDRTEKRSLREELQENIVISQLRG